MAAMLCDVVRRRRWVHVPVIHAIIHFDHKKRVAWVPFLCIRVVSFSIIMGLCLGALWAARARSAIILEKSPEKMSALIR